MSEEGQGGDESPGEDEDAGEAPVTSLDGVTTGRWIVTTIHGTRHYLDLDNGPSFVNPDRTASPGPPRGSVWGRSRPTGRR